MTERALVAEARYPNGKPVAPGEVRLRLALRSGPEQIPETVRLIRMMGDAFQPDSMATVAAAYSGNRRDLLTVVAGEGGQNAEYLRAHLHAMLGCPDDAVTEWRKLLNAGSCSYPTVWLEAARNAHAVGLAGEAASWLRRGLCLRPPYSFHARCHQLLTALRRQNPGGIRTARVAVLGSHTTGLLTQVLQALCFRDRIDADFYEGPYGTYRQEILDPGSGLYRFRPTITLLFIHPSQLSLPAVSPDEHATVDAIVSDLHTLWVTLQQRQSTHIIQHALDLSVLEPYGPLADSQPGGRHRVMRLVNLRLAAEAPGSVSVLDTTSVVARVGVEAWRDSAIWHRAKQYPALKALPALAEAQMEQIRAILGLNRKVLVCDLDNTLWGGVIGEDGLEGIRLGPGTPEGEAHAELQQYLRELKSRGVLLAVCSKNNIADARLPFEQHPGTVLRMSDFVAFRANWNDKVDNIREIAGLLSLGTDSFVFLDDNPLERAWVASQLPEVAVIELPTSPFAFLQALDESRHFGVLTLSAEDLTRSEMYRAEAARESLRGATQSVDEFLAGLQMRASVSAVNSSNAARVAQLCNKTNQFNLATRRYTPAQVDELARRDDAWTGVFRLQDRFGDHGIIGVIFCVPHDSPATWSIDAWLMSCRVLGRQAELYMFDRLLNASAARGVKRLVGRYVRTPKNGLVADHYDKLGFRRLHEDVDEMVYVFDVAQRRSAYCPFIVDESGRPDETTTGNQVDA